MTFSEIRSYTTDFRLTLEKKEEAKEKFIPGNSSHALPCSNPFSYTLPPLQLPSLSLFCFVLGSGISQLHVSMS
jgi:hypothetical protein